MQTWFLQLGNLLVNLIIVILVAALVVRSSKFLFAYDLRKALAADNRSAAYFLIGILLMLGLVVGLFEL